ncbi:MAG: hypothetical protein KC996_05855 [Phycisphaerales bacterium]|nr:hypothetical protein [Phycisphaerales bacterium]
MIRGVLDILGGLYEMLCMGIRSRFNLRGDYWSWRTHTAFPDGDPPPGHSKPRLALEYFIWAHRIRKLR